MAFGKTPVLLLKTRSAPTDSYEDYFRNGGYDPRFVPVLDHRFTDSGVSTLQNLIREGAFRPMKDGGPQNAKAYGGLIFTSQRAVEAFAHTLETIEAPSWQGVFAADMPIYVVGPATARGIKALNLPCPVLGEHTGNGDVLAAFIRDHYNQIHAGETKKPDLLFAVGEQHRDVIVKVLAAPPAEQSIRVQELIVYETAVMESFKDQFALDIQPSFSENSPQWIVVFSPTGCKAMLEGLDLLDPQSGRIKQLPAGRRKRALIATIGPTTRDYLDREFGLEPDVCSIKPSPDGLGASIAEFEKNNPELRL